MAHLGEHVQLPELSWLTGVHLESARRRILDTAGTTIVAKVHQILEHLFTKLIKQCLWINV